MIPPPTITTRALSTTAGSIAKIWYRLAVIDLSVAERRRLLRAAREMSEAARRVILGKAAGGFKVRTKPDSSFVTDADLAAERRLRAEIIRRFPDHGIVGEELPPRNPESPYQWILDPIDGTLSFTRGIPLYGSILGLFHEGRPVVGVIDHPALGERYSAAAGLGAWRNAERIRLRKTGRSPEGEIVATGDRSHFKKMGREAEYDRLMVRHPQVRSYADCFGHTLAFSGAIGAMVDYGIKVWDLAASRVLIEEAGGRYLCVERQGEGPEAFHGIILGRPEVVEWLEGLFAPPEAAAA